LKFFFERHLPQKVFTQIVLKFFFQKVYPFEFDNISFYWSPLG